MMRQVPEANKVKGTLASNKALYYMKDSRPARSLMSDDTEGGTASRRSSQVTARQQLPRATIMHTTVTKDLRIPGLHHP